MAKPAKKSESTITRIKASDSTAKKSSKPAKAVTAVKPAKTAPSEPSQKRRRPSFGPFGRLIEYIKGSWYELRQVRWPDRRATWGMTGALLAFTTFFVIIILLLDAAFAQLFKLIIGS